VGFVVNRDTGADILRVLRFPLPILIPPTAPHLSSIIRGWYNRPVSGRLTKWTQSHPTQKKTTITKPEDGLCAETRTRGPQNTKQERFPLPGATIRRQRPRVPLASSLRLQHYLKIAKSLRNRDGSVGRATRLRAARPTNRG
jgi:hypothetical protein